MSVVINGTTGITSPGGDVSSADNTVHGITVGLGGGGGAGGYLFTPGSGGGDGNAGGSGVVVLKWT